MKAIENLRLTTKAVVPVMLMAMMFVGILVFGYEQNRQVTEDYSGIVNNDDAAALKMSRFSKSATAIPYAVYRLSAYACTKGDAANCNIANDEFKANVAQARIRLDDAIRLDPDREAHAAALADFKSRFNGLVNDIQKVVDLGLVDDDSSMKFLKALDPKFMQLSADVTTFNDMAVKENADQARTIQDDAVRRSLTMLAVGLGAIVMGIAFSVWLSVSQVSRPLTRLSTTMRTLAGGDLDVEVVGQTRADEVGDMSKAVQVFKDNALRAVAQGHEVEQTRRQSDADRQTNEQVRVRSASQQAHVVDAIADGLTRLSDGQLTFRIVEAFASDYEKLRLDFNGAMEKLQDTMKVVSTNTSAIRSGTDEISSASDDLSKRTEQQAASLEETAAALDEITATVRKTAEGSKHAREVVGQAKQGAEHSGHVVRQAVDAMSGIQKSSNQIGNIIGVIDEIAFQTNLLALNAGVEAARAGDAGRGFAVVASEVRALAQRSAEAAKEIKTLISTSSAQVELGVDLVGQTGQALAAIVAQVSEINGIVGEIAASAQEQATGLDQVNIAVNQMDQVTQQNAAMVEESTAASHALARETEELARLIGQFEIGGSSSAATPMRAAVRPGKAPPAARPVAAMKAVGSGGAVRKPAPEASGWQAF